jgi:hypothetical protein
MPSFAASTVPYLNWIHVTRYLRHVLKVEKFKICYLKEPREK